MEERRREHLKAALQASLDRDKVRILLATDSASEGIDLQNRCHRVIHYDIRFNPNRRASSALDGLVQYGKDHYLVALFPIHGVDPRLTYSARGGETHRSA
jgi:hypothetical protein